MRILGPLPWPTISPVTVTPASACASLVTVSPSTSSRAGRVTESPASPTRRLTVNRSPTATLCCRPPAFTTAYTTALLDRCCQSRDASWAHPGAGAGCWTGRTPPPPRGRAAPGAARAAPRPGPGAEPGRAVQPVERTRAAATGSNAAPAAAPSRVPPRARGEQGGDGTLRLTGRRAGGAAG